MSCVAKFIINNEVISLDLSTGPDSYLTNEEILKVLADNPVERNKICNLLQNTMYKHGTIKSLKFSDLSEMQGLKGNTDVEFLRNEFPDIQFPEGVNANVLLIDNLDIGKKNIRGRIINSNGEEVFIIQNSNNNRDIQKLANFLQVRKQMQDQSFIFNEESSYYKDLTECLNQRNKNGKEKIDNIFNLVLDFIYNRSKYTNLYFTKSNGEKESVYAYLSKINNTILEYSDRVSFSDPFVNVINQLRSHLDNNDGFISYQALYGAIQQFHNDILETLNIKSLKEFKDFFNQSEYSQELSSIFPYQEGESRYKQLLDGLFSSEPEYSWSYLKNTNKGIVLRSEPKTLQAKYGIEYDTIHSFDILNDDYYGYKIYGYTDDQNNKKFVASRGYLTEDSMSKVYNSIEDLQKYIQNSIQRQDIKKNSIIEFKYRTQLDDGWSTELDSFTVKSKTSLIPGSIIESIDVPVRENQEFYNSNESSLFKASNQNFNSFSKVVNGWSISDTLKNDILSYINTPEKIALFVYKINELFKADRTNEQGLSEVLETIQNAKKNYYYIDTKTVIPTGYSYKVIPTNPSSIENYKRNKQTPVIELMSAIGQVLQSKFGVNVNLLTAQEIQEKFPNIDSNSTKAFVSNGDIYINTTSAESSDPLHEFTHLILGVLKSNQDLRGNYEQLMYMVSKTTDGKNKIQKLRDIYTDSSEMDIMEEAFVDLFSKHVMGRLNPNLDNLFVSVDKYMKDASKIIFNNSIEDISSFYGTGIETIFKRFNSDVASLLNGNGINFEQTKQYRRISNWISNKIKEGEIKEQCYG